jgi:hypothetical protein
VTWLGRLKSEIPPGGVPTKLTKPLDGPLIEPTKLTKPGFVGFVSTPARHIQKFEGRTSAAANDSPTDPDRWCWPHSDAMTGAELDAYAGRVALFHDRGLTLARAEVLADRLLARDRDGDERRTCLECVHLVGHGANRRCTAWRLAGFGGPGVAAALVVLPQRCEGFTPAHALSNPLRN